jgi:UDP-N-acetylmuramate dehydrogenase
MTPSRLADLTTLRVGGPARATVVADSEAALVEAVADCDARGEPVLLVGGGSNLLVCDDGFEGTLVRIATRGRRVDDASACAGVSLRVAAGEPWDDVVQAAVQSGWSGIEALSGIPGASGATPVQNVGAYGQEVADTIASVRVWDRSRSRIQTFAAADCAFSYRHSRFKAERFAEGTAARGPRYVVLEVVFQLRIAEESAPIRYTELATSLGVEPGGRAPLAQVRAAVLKLRCGKGMVLNASDHDTWSAGSFFTNPVMDATDADRLPEQAPRWPAGGGRVKTSAAWLIEHAGFSRGYGLPGPAALSTKHTLALTNRGCASAQDLLALARTVRAGVEERFGIVLEPEPVLVGCRL